MNNQQRQQVIEQIKTANHVLVTVSANPTVDELAASIGLTLAINKLDKHATTVFSGIVPSTIEFLQPEKTIETTTDSLRDFIIALDKSKADKLRYKVEDDVVRIFITPYRTTITGKDLEFSQGDFNVDLVIALGVTKRQDLDKAITAHGRILHDATIVALTKRETTSDLGSINWQDEQASSLCEMLSGVITDIDPKVIDGQMATALLTGIIAETDRFKNEKTTPMALSLSSRLMSAGANQQLIAEKLEEPEPAPELHREEVPEKTQEQRDNGELEIDHSDLEVDKIHIDDNGNLNLADKEFDELPQNEELPPPIDPDNSETEEEKTEVTQEYIYTEPASQVDEPDPGEGYDVAQSLYDDLAKTEDTDVESEPTLKQPDSSATPMMQHEKVIAPPVRPGDLPKSDKPFDPQEAMRESGMLPAEPVVSQPPITPQVAEQSTPLETVEPKPEPEPVPAPIEPVVSVPQAAIQPDIPIVEAAQVTPDFSDSSSKGGDSLEDLEKSVGSPHIVASQTPQVPEEPSKLPPELDVARNSVIDAISSQPPVFPEPSQAIGSQPINLDPPTVDSSSSSQDPNAPPPVPPPMTPQFYDEDGNNSNPFNKPAH
jgi:nanoRNase/pAp phosphatase (c-di-AMP/oligoRNAs hydrolase)